MYGDESVITICIWIEVAEPRETIKLPITIEYYNIFLNILLLPMIH